MRWPYVKGDVIAEIFWVLLLVFYPSNLMYCHLFWVLEIGLHVEWDDMWTEELIHNVTIASDHSKHDNTDRVFNFHLYECKYLLRLTPKFLKS